MKKYLELEMKIVVLAQQDIITNSSSTTNPSLSDSNWNDYDDTVGDFFS